ncbi:GIY-YIG nuclease family protein [Algoriphagus sp. D3-2-R+10]|uniref:GIY-YIG nuclease family protein n=1 Tax=Algoriphagus aurantiacus TaxID=3103948 RepID=UPI002B3BA3BA|nr:GIY-YIG nuclease family protein [Algoriphagus sp. D3-2-R+10]MEB2776913.1 GIY-YIG nuclease family protein [Algoriphagus sp. D3-2-R+10]
MRRSEASRYREAPAGSQKSSPKRAAFLIFSQLVLNIATLYILFSEELNKFYVGACSNLERSMYEHNIGQLKFTSAGIPWKLIYKETFEDLQSAKRKSRR